MADYRLDLVCQFTWKSSRLLDLLFEISLLLPNHCITTITTRNVKANRTVFGVVNKVLHLNQTIVPKICKSNKDMAHDFNKIANINSSFCLIKAIRNTANISIKTGDFSQSIKDGLLKPLTKAVNLDCNILSNYRPVSNVFFLCKIIKSSCFSFKQIFVN